jgi:Putative regulator of cell autolysis
MKLPGSALHKIKLTMDQLSYRRKLMLSFIIAIILPIMFSNIITYYITTTLMEGQVEYSFSQTFKQVEMNLDRKLSKIMEVSNLINKDTNLRKILSSKSKKEFYDELVDYRYMDKYFSSLEDSFNIYRIRLYIPLNTSYSDEGFRFFNIKDLYTIEGIDSSILKYGGNIYWKSTYVQHYKFNNNKYVVSAISLIKDYYSFDVIGVYFIDILEDDLYKNIEDITGKDGTITSIIDTKGTVISSKDKSQIGKKYNYPYLDNIIKSEGNFKFNNHIIFAKKISNSDMILVSDIPLSMVKNKTSIITKIAVIITVIAFLFSILLSIFLSKELSKKLNYLIKAMKNSKYQEQDGFLKEIVLPVTLSQSDEIGQLITTYNKMANDIRKLIEEVYTVKLHESENRFKILQAQINPHFLYNILESIKSYINSNKAEKANDLIISLAQFYRVALSKGKDKITIREELEMTKNYVNMQRTCYGNVFDLSIDIDENIYPFLIVKFTLQPLVENAINHGLRQRTEKYKGSIIIKGYFETDDIIIKVIDNGVGIEENFLNRIKISFVEGIIDSSKGYGLYNVNARLQAYYSREYGLKIDSNPDMGTTVEVVFPQEV